MTEIAARLARPIQRLGKPSTFFLVSAVVVAVAGVSLLARAYTLRDAVLPGVSVAGVVLGGGGRYTVGRPRRAASDVPCVGNMAERDAEGNCPDGGIL